MLKTTLLRAIPEVAGPGGRSCPRWPAFFVFLVFWLLLVPGFSSSRPLLPEEEEFLKKEPGQSARWEESFVFPVPEEDIHVWDKSFPLVEVLRKISSPGFHLPAPDGCFPSSDGFYLPFNQYVSTYVNYYTKRSRRSFRHGYKRSGLYERIIMREIKRRGLPEELLYLCMNESMFNPRAISPANAKGLWQFMYSTGRKYNLTINYWIDERYDPAKSTRAAMEYLTDLYEKFGDWHLVAAAYNCGEYLLSRKLRRTGCEDYWCLVEKDALPYETTHYVPKIVAMAVIASNPERYGFYNLKKSSPYNYSTVTVDDATELGLVAELTGVSTSRIKELNPEILRFCTPPGVRRYRIKVPAGKDGVFSRKYARLSPDKRHAFKKHEVETGQSLHSIARGYGTSYKLLASVNGMSTKSLLRQGQTLTVPVPKNRKFDPASPKPPRTRSPAEKRRHSAPKGKKKHIYVVEPGDTMWTIAKANGISIEDLKEWNPGLTSDNLYYGDRIAIYSRQKPKSPQKSQKPQKRKGPSREFAYTVRKGDRCYYMARHYGITSRNIIEKNDLDENCSIRPGQELVLVVPEKAPRSLPPTAEEAPPPKSAEDYSPPAPSLPATEKKAAQPAGTEKVTYEVTEGDCLWLIARKHDCHMEQVLAWNGLPKDYTPKPGQELVLYVEPGFESPAQESRPDKETRKSSGSRTENAESRGSRGPALRYRVQQGDNLWTVARVHDVHVKEIKKWNDLESNTLHKGQVLTIKPGPGYESGPAKREDSSSESATKKSSSGSASDTRKVVYKVEQGDSLWGIARYHDVHVEQILSWNDMNKENAVVRPGDTLVVYVSEDWDPPEAITPASPVKDSNKKSPDTSHKKEKKDIGKRGKPIIYVVEKGDSLWSIARKHDVHMWEIKKLNDMETESVRPGQKLEIKPGPGYRQ
ncbi:MAG: LysM peptidoglycan-binding domain-containing protein [bacterium]